MRKTQQTQGKRSKARGPRFRLPSQRYTAEEVAALIKACGDDTLGLRLAAMVMLLYRTGLRISECLALTPRDLDLPRGLLHVGFGKRRKERTCGIGPDCIPHLERWLTARARLGMTSEQPIFCRVRPATGAKISTAAIRQALPALAKKAGLVGRVHAHGFRVTCASGMAESNTPLLDISSQLGHSRASITDIYLRKVAPDRLAAVMRAHVEGAKPAQAPGMSEADVQRIAQAVAALGTKISS